MTIIEKLKEKCTYIQIQKQLKGEYYTCGQEGHFSTKCPKRENIYTKEIFAVDACNEDLLTIDGNISDNETIYSIETISLPDVEINYQEQVEPLINQFVELMQKFKIEWGMQTNRFNWF
jgi:Zinc knuckle